MGNEVPAGAGERPSLRPVLIVGALLLAAALGAAGTTWSGVPAGPRPSTGQLVTRTQPRHDRAVLVTSNGSPETVLVFAPAVRSGF
ncbi:MAG: hypothetical protein ACRDZP_09095 [Acidimicrobiales bacterium]